MAHHPLAFASTCELVVGYMLILYLRTIEQLTCISKKYIIELSALSIVLDGLVSG